MLHPDYKKFPGTLFSDRLSQIARTWFSWCWRLSGWLTLLA